MNSFRLSIILLALFLQSPPVHADDYVGKITAEKILVTTTAGNGQPHRYLRTEQPEVTALTVVIPPGAETGWHLHTVPVYAYVLAGKLTVELADGTLLDFKQGDAIVEVQNLAHNGSNHGAEPVKLVVFYTGEVGRPNVTKQGKPASSQAKTGNVVK